MRTLEEVKQFFENDVYATGTTGIRIEKARPGYAKVSLQLDARHMNAAGRVMGAVYYTMADFAFAVHANHLHPMTVTQGGHINYIRAAITDEVTATAVERVRSGHNTVSEVVVRNSAGETVCICTFNGFVKDVAREELEKKFEER